ncbi:hypothetical protein OQI89_13535 [Lentilactobacillus diolivorans]|mgnify:CR=1 FL=1|uniref:hypothetical protein n=1 Tax=Lentilactobacillus diolivorans TaxID=179838 RepID=UPI002469523B|nr:hypothetical protein [Lentilactobacillus diolivorans]MDH5106874.1 hypothetical protein [Lentilactobacillus diolivorans]
MQKMIKSCLIVIGILGAVIGAFFIFGYFINQNAVTAGTMSVYQNIVWLISGISIIIFGFSCFFTGGTTITSITGIMAFISLYSYLALLNNYFNVWILAYALLLLAGILLKYINKRLRQKNDHYIR